MGGDDDAGEAVRGSGEVVAGGEALVLGGTDTRGGSDLGSESSEPFEEPGEVEAGRSATKSARIAPIRQRIAMAPSIDSIARNAAA